LSGSGSDPSDPAAFPPSEQSPRRHRPHEEEQAQRSASHIDLVQHPQEGSHPRPPAEGVESLTGLAAPISSPKVLAAWEPGVSWRAGPPDFGADPEVVRAVVEGERLSYAFLLNPTFAAEVSLIDPLPHQRMAVYEHMLPQPRLRFLLADDAGAGKTIMTGLYIREMLSRRLIGRVLIVPPAGLVGNWQHELRSLFNLPFRIVLGSEAREGNPFVGPASDLLIVSVDTLAGERLFRRLQEPEVEPYDLVVFDEAHKLSASYDSDGRLRATERYRLAEALAGIPTDDARWSLSWSCHHVLLLTATPHMGKADPYYCLWRLLEPELLSTRQAFEQFPAQARRRYFLRRVKEELVTLDGRPLYPPRIATTLRYELSPAEQELYEATTAYIRTTYNRALLLNREAARLAMSVFQRRLASSTYALLRSLERRLRRLDELIAQVRQGELPLSRLHQLQVQAASSRLSDPLETKTADEEESVAGEEEHERVEQEILQLVLAASLQELEAERAQVAGLLQQARRVYEQGAEAKFEKLREVLRDPRFAGEKLIIFTEHRDTLVFLQRRLEALGFTGQLALIHGGMTYTEREQAVAFFRRPLAEGGARYLLATDAAGEGVNLQVAWLLVNYDLPWNPARLEQRMGRIHRYGQRHDSVYIINLVAGNTREGYVMERLLEKLEAIRQELGSDKVFDVIGRLLEGVSLREYMERVVLGPAEETEEIGRRLEESLTAQRVRAAQEEERRHYGLSAEPGADAVRRELPRLRQELEREGYRRVLPGYVRAFVERAAPLLGLRIEEHGDGTFALHEQTPGALTWLEPALERYPPRCRARLTVTPPRADEEAIFLYPGEPLFDRLRDLLWGRYGEEAGRGAVFVDPMARRPYVFSLLRLAVRREAEPGLRALQHPELVQVTLVGLCQEEDGTLRQCPAEQLLLLRAGGGEQQARARQVLQQLGPRWSELTARALTFVRETIGGRLLAERREALLGTVRERRAFLERAFTYQEGELAERRRRLYEKVQAGDGRAKGELTRVKALQQSLQQRRAAALATLSREPELLALSEVSLLAQALVLPSTDPEDEQRYAAAVEEMAMRVARAYEEERGALVWDVSTPEKARAAGLESWPGFDLLSRRPSGEERAIEVKGRVGTGPIEMTENEYRRAQNLGAKYWLYCVFECEKLAPVLRRVQNPHAKLTAYPKGGVLFSPTDIQHAAEE
jgi:superfamily II DNA or RNA helicase